MTDPYGPIVQDADGINLLRVVSLKQLLLIIKILASTAIVLHLVYFVAASIVHHNGPWAATYRLGITAYAIATDFVVIGMACIIDFFSRK